MDFSFVLKSIIFSFFVFMIIFAISFVSSQKVLVDSNNYGIKDSVKEAINIGQYRANGDITFSSNKLILATINNYLENNKLKVDDVSFDIAIDEDNDIVTVRIYTDKELFNASSQVDYTFSYQVVRR